MLFGQPCSRCGDVSPAFQRHQCRPTRPRRPELGPRISGPGFAMRWVRKPFYLGSQVNPIWIASASPFCEATRHLRPVKDIATECIEHDRRCTLDSLCRRHRGVMADNGAAAKVPARFRRRLLGLTSLARKGVL